MKPAPFTYVRATSVVDATEQLSAYAGSARVLAGGQSLMPMLNMRLWQPTALIDINDIDELDDVTFDGERTALGALVRYSTIERSADLAERLPLLARVVTHIGDRQVRNRGTIGGSLVQGDPTGEMPLACLVLGATVVVVGVHGERRIPLPALYEGSYATSVRAEELLTSVEFPAHPQHFAFAEVCRKHNDFAVLSVAVTGNRDADGRWADVRIGLGGVADTPVLAHGAAARLNGTSLADDDLAAASAACLDDIDPATDVRATAEYRRHLVPIHVQRVLTALRATPQPVEVPGHPGAPATTAGYEGATP